jgi:dihydropteroate synthase
MFTLNCKGKILSLEQPVVMGILNITADSFYKGYLNDSDELIISRVAAMLTEGAAIIDIGSQTTKPGADRIAASEEADRVLPVIEKIMQQFPGIVISVDTFYASVASYAVQSGASIVNDISAGKFDEAMIGTVAKLKVPYICMHMQGEPKTMQQDPQYDDICRELLDFFISKTDECVKAGIHDVIIDPGFGFGKNMEHNYTLLKNLSIFNMLNKPILAGLSRKGMIYKPLGITANDALNGTTVVNTLALQNGAHILRVHDVKEAVEAIKLFRLYNAG